MVVWLVLDVVRGPEPLGPVAVEVPPRTAAGDRVCPALLAALPERLDDLTSRPTTPAAPSIAAWGEPAAVLRCGVPPPRGFRAGSTPIEVDGVAWFQRLQSGAVTWTTVDRPVPVEVVIPVVYQSQGALLVDLAPAIARTLPEVTPRPR